MFDPTVPTRCECGHPECPTRLLDGQRVRTITDPASGVAFVHPDDVLECMSAAINQILAIEGPGAALGLTLTLSVGEFVAQWMADAQRHVPAGYVFSPAPAADNRELAAIVDELDNGDQMNRLDEALRKILDEG